MLENIREIAFCFCLNQHLFWKAIFSFEFILPNQIFYFWCPYNFLGVIYKKIVKFVWRRRNVIKIV